MVKTDSVIEAFSLFARSTLMLEVGEKKPFD